MATRKSVDQILDGAADILEKHGWVTETCYDDRTGGFCAIGAIAKAVYPKTALRDISDLAYVDERVADGKPVDPRHLEAVHFLAKRIGGAPTAETVYAFNDHLPSGVTSHRWNDDVTFDEKVRYKSSRKVVQKLRNAAKAYRKQQEKAAAA